MKILRNLVVWLGLFTSIAAVAQDLTVTVSAAVGGPADLIARNLGRDLGGILGKTVHINNVVGEKGARAAREFGTARPDGNQILFLHAPAGERAPEASGFVPIATVVGENPKYQWIGVFAPSGTPSSIAKNLERAVLEALSSPSFGKKTGDFKGGLSPTPGDSAQLARLVAQSSGSGGAAIAGAGSDAPGDDPKVVGGRYKP